MFLSVVLRLTYCRVHYLTPLILPLELWGTSFELLGELVSYSPILPLHSCLVVQYMYESYLSLISKYLTTHFESPLLENFRIYIMLLRIRNH